MMVGGPYDGKVLRIFETDQQLLTWEGLGGSYIGEEGKRKAKGKMAKKATHTMTWDPSL